MAILKAKIARIDAKIASLQPLAAGDVEAQAEIVDFRAMRASTCEKITNLKAPTERHRIVSAALGTRQKQLAAAEAVVDTCKTALSNAED